MITQRKIQATIQGAIIKGEQGIQGLQGLPGEVDYILVNKEIQRLVDDFISQLDYSTLRGEDGLSGLNGIDGVDGEDGLNGLDGANGKDAEFDYNFAKKEIQNLFKEYKPSIIETTKILNKAGETSYKIDKENITKEIKKIFNSWKKDLGNFKAEKGEKGERGAYGPQGPIGPAGVGVVSGGNTGQVLTKKSNVSYDVEWKTPTGGGGGGSVAWGGIIGTLSDQTDLQTALDTKQNTITNSDFITQGSTNLFLTTNERTKLTNTSNTNTGDNAVNSLYSGLVSNATHTGEVTGATALTVDKTVISNKTEVTPAAEDYILIADTSDSNNLKRALISTLPGGGGGGSYTDEQAQDAVGNILVDTTSIDAIYDDAGNTISFQREALTGAITASKNSNTTALGSFTVSQLNTAISDGDVATGGGTATGSNTGDQTITLTSDVTGSGAGSFATTIANNAVSLAKMADVATGTVFYRKTAETGDPEVQTLATLKTDLGLTGTNSGDQDISNFETTTQLNKRHQ